MNRVQRAMYWVCSDWIKICLLILLMNVSFMMGADSEGLDNVVSDTAVIELKTYVGSSKVPLNQKVRFKLELSWIGKMGRYQIVDIPQPILTNLLMEGSGSENRLERLNNDKFRSVKVINYQFKPVELGMAYIDGLVIKYQDTRHGNRDILQSQRMMIEIIEPVSGRSQSPIKAVIYIILLVAFSGAILFFLILFIQKRREINNKAVPVIPLEEQFLQRIAYEIDPKGTNLREMLLRLDRIFREYLWKAFKLSIGEASLEKIYDYLNASGIAAEQMTHLEAFFRKLDLIKFAGGNIDPSEFALMYEMVENILIERQKIWKSEQEQIKEK